MDNFNEIQELLQQKADYHARLQLIPYDGSPEIKELNGKKYLYVRKRIGSRLKSTYVDIYSEELHLLLLKNAKAATDVQKILNLKHAWEFILDADVIQSKSDYYLLCRIL